MNAVGQVRALVRAGRRRPGWTDWYLLLAAVVIGSLLAGGPLAEVLGRAVPPLPPYRAAALLSLVVAGGAGLLALAAAVGPVTLSPADACWLVLSPLDRRAVLARAVAVVGVVAALAGGVGGVAMRWAAGLPAYGWGPVGAAAGAGAAVGVCAAGVAVLAQAAGVGVVVRRVAAGVGCAAVGWGTAAALWPGWSGWPRAGSLLLSGRGPAGVGAVAVLVSALVWWRLVVFPAGAVLAASTRWGVVTDAAVGLEPSFVSRVVEDGFWRGRVLRSRPWPGWLSGWAAPAWQDWRMLGRRPFRLVGSLVVAAVPGVLAVAAGAARLCVAVVVLAGALSVASAAASGVRREAGVAVSGRLLRVGGVAVVSARLVLPGVLAAVWLVAASSVLVAVGVWGSWWWLLFGVAVAPVLAVGVLRLAGRGWVDHASVPVVMPQTGSWVPTGWILWWVTGWDAVVVGGLPSVWVWSGGPGGWLVLLALQVVVAGVVVWVWVRRVAGAG